MTDELVTELLARHRMGNSSPYILGLVGCPGVGKSTLAHELACRLRDRGLTVSHVPMDGFHLADEELDRQHLLERKGAAETFDAWGYLHLLRRARSERGGTLYAPAFERTLEQPIAGAIRIPHDVEILITEGNYLLLQHEPWLQIRAELDETWFLEVDSETRIRRLIHRHIEFGKTPSAARDWVSTIDEVNAEWITRTREYADRIVKLH